MSFFDRFAEHLLGKKNEHDKALESLALARCYDCGVRFWGASEDLAYQQLSRHAVLAHDIEPDFDSVEHYDDEAESR